MPSQLNNFLWRYAKFGFSNGEIRDGKERKFCPIIPFLSCSFPPFPDQSCFPFTFKKSGQLSGKGNIAFLSLTCTKMVAGKKVPEPNKDVDFLVENVEWQNAKRVVFLDVAWGSEFVKSAFCHPGKHEHHRVYSILLIITIFVHRCQLIKPKYLCIWVNVHTLWEYLEISGNWANAIEA